MRREMCACGIAIVVPRAEWELIALYVKRHNRSVLHREWRMRMAVAA